MPYPAASGLIPKFRKIWMHVQHQIFLCKWNNLGANERVSQWSNIVYGPQLYDYSMAVVAQLDNAERLAKFF